jgi:predicted DNA-binding transcriptional regulator YafY
MYAPGFQMQPLHRRRLDLLNGACVDRHPVHIAYATETGAQSRRTIRPLGLYFWSGVWTVVAWCELRDDFRTFRIDRIAESTVHPATFTQPKGRRLVDYLRIVRETSPEMEKAPKRA